MDRLWMLVPLTFLCAALFVPLGLLAGAGGALYAHRVGKSGLRNALAASLVVVVLLLAALHGPSGL